MKLENRILILDAQVANEQINELVSDIILNIENIDKVEIENIENGITTSALFSLLFAIKQRREEIVIPFYDDYKSVSNMGKVLFVRKD